MSSVAVAKNEGKNPLFTLEERVEMARRVVKPHPECEGGFGVLEGLLVDYVVANNARCIVLRGLRAISDFEFEFPKARAHGHRKAEMKMWKPFS